MALQPMVLDRHVLALDVAGFVEAFAERGHITRGGIGRPVSDKPDHRHRRLLRTRRKRPRRRTAYERDELAPLACPTPSSGDSILAAQTSTLIGAETGIKTIAAVHSQCRFGSKGDKPAKG